MGFATLTLSFTLNPHPNPNPNPNPNPHQELRLEREARALLPNQQGEPWYRHYMLPLFRCLWRLSEVIFPFLPILHPGGYVYRFTHWQVRVRVRVRVSVRVRVRVSIQCG